MSTPSTILLYRSTCTKCRVLSLLIVWLSCGWIHRVPFSSPEASMLYEAYDMRPGKFALIGGRHIFLGWRAFPGLATLAVMAFRSRFSKIQMPP